MSSAGARLVVGGVLFVTLSCGGDDIVNPTTGTLVITTATTGSGTDPDGYTIILDGAGRGPIPASGSATLDDVRTGTHQVQLTGIAANCQLQGQGTLVITVAAGDTATAAFALVCGVSTGLEHRIGIRGRGELYDRATGATFVPRGNNYVVLAQQVAPGGDLITYHSTFNPGLYDPARIDQVLAAMQADGYNVVRSWINHCCSSAAVGNPAGGLSDAYIVNVVDFLRRAKAHGLYTILTVDDVPAVGGYTDILYSGCCELFNGWNLHYLSAGGVLANQNFWHDFVQALRQHGAPTETILAYELRNELTYESDLPPLSLDTGQVATANGRSYDLADPASRQQMMDDNMVYWSDQMVATIRALDPDALVAVGFFQPQAPNPTRIGDPRVTRPFPAIAQSTVDIIDLHAYPGLELTLPQYVENYAMAGFTRQAIIMGEFGAIRRTYGSTGEAAQALKAWQIASCRYGFAGWLTWTWDLESPPDFWSATSMDSAIDRSLAPAQRADPCAS